MFNLLFTTQQMRPFLHVFCFCTITFCAAAQTGDLQPAVIDPLQKLLPPFIERFTPGGPPPEEDTLAQAPLAQAPLVYNFRRAKRISAAYEGFVIQLAISERPLLQEDPLFKKYGNIQFDRTAEGLYAYQILVPFSSEKAVRTFLENVILPRVPEAKLVEYKNGKRT